MRYLTLHSDFSAFFNCIHHYSASLAIQLLIIWHLDYQNAKFHKPHPYLQKPRESWWLRNLAKWHPIVKTTRSTKNVLIIEEKLGICKLMATDRSYTKCYGSRRSTAVTETWKKMSDMGMGIRCLKIGVQLKLDDHRIFGLGQQQSEKAMLVTWPMLILLYPDWRHF